MIFSREMEATHNNIIGWRMKIGHFEQHVNQKNSLYLIRQVNTFRGQQKLETELNLTSMYMELVIGSCFNGF